MIGAMNLLNWLGMFAAAGVYKLCAVTIERNAWSPSLTFALAALLLLPVVWLLPRGDEELE